MILYRLCDRWIRAVHYDRAGVSVIVESCIPSLVNFGWVGCQRLVNVRTRRRMVLVMWIWANNPPNALVQSVAATETHDVVRGIGI